MPFYRICPRCCTYLEFGEMCGCQSKKETAPGTANTESCRVEIGLPTKFSTSMITKTTGKIKEEF